jgi:anthranilate phosphoribosyltransferase
MVVFNTAAALWVADLATDWADGARRARDVIDGGAARETLLNWVRLARECSAR